MSTTIGSLSTSTTSSIRGYGGLASGLDRDSLIEGMTSGTTSKITAQQQKKQQLEWKQATVQSITNLMVNFANKYTSSWSSSTNLFSSVLWGRSNITTTGANSKFVSVSGTANSSNSVQIMGVKQLAKQAQYSSKAEVSKKTLETGAIDTGDQTVDNLVGKKISITYGDKTYSIILSSTIQNDDETTEELSYGSAQEIADSINKLLAKESVGSNATLADKIKVSASGMDEDGKGGSITFTNLDKDGNKCLITGGNALSYLGFEEPKSSKEEDAIQLSSEDDPKSVTGKNEVNDLTRQVSFAERIAGKELTFNYNGKSVSIKVPSKEELEAKGEDGDTVLATLKTSLQKEMDKAFGKDRIEVGLENNKLSFTTMTPGNPPTKDNTSTLTLTSGSTELVGKNGALNVAFGESNRLNLNASLAESGLKLNGIDLTKGTTIKINDAEIKVESTDTVYTLMDKINSDPNSGVKVSYQEAADKFVFTATDEGLSGRIDFSGNEGDSAELMKAIFGADDESLKEVVRGQDAIVSVKYAGSDEPVTLTRGSNSFTLDGLTISVKGEFGYLKDANGETTDKLDPTAEAVGIDAQVNTDSIVDAVKTMVEEYNAIIELVNKELTTKPDRDYAPLTSEQKKELSEDEIKLYEEKAKAGMLFGDSDLRTLSSDLRFIISGGYSQALENIGISTSSSYSDGGKLVFDESKFRAALESDPESVEKLFTDKGSVDERGNTNYGLATNIQSVMDKYVKTLGSWETKGILIRKAGTESSALSLTENFMYKQIAEIDKIITKLQATLESERDRYIQQFTSLETLISQMNSQSDWLAQIGGSY